MIPEQDVKYQITYREGSEEKTTVGRYRGLKTSDDLAQGGKSTVDVADAEKRHWFQLDGTHGFLSVAQDDLVSVAPAD
jgi:hypothetical protein